MCEKKGLQKGKSLCVYLKLEERGQMASECNPTSNKKVFFFLPSFPGSTCLKLSIGFVTSLSRSFPVMTVCCFTSTMLQMHGDNSNSSSYLSEHVNPPAAAKSCFSHNKRIMSWDKCTCFPTQRNDQCVITIRARLFCLVLLFLVCFLLCFFVFLQDDAKTQKKIQNRISWNLKDETRTKKEVIILCTNRQLQDFLKIIVFAFLGNYRKWAMWFILFSSSTYL